LRVCYLDESGDTAWLPTPASPIPPAFVPAAVIVKQVRIQSLTAEFLGLKQRFFPNLMPRTGHYLDCVRREIKGADIRRELRAGRRTIVRHHLGFLDQFVGLLERHEVKIVGRVWIKGIGKAIDPTALYTSSVQSICTYFQDLLEREEDVGFVIADSRTASQNSQVAHSVFTQKFRLQGDPYERMLEMPTYGHSENHVGSPGGGPGLLRALVSLGDLRLLHHACHQRARKRELRGSQDAIRKPPQAASTSLLERTSDGGRHRRL
jgi:hypothetical protein